MVQPAQPEEFEKFWTGIVGVEGEYDPDNPGLIEWAAALGTIVDQISSL